MPYLQSEAIILRSTNFQDSSKIITSLTRDYGLLAVLAKGARNPKSKFRGNLEIFSHVELVYAYKETRQVQTLSEAQLIAFHQGILNDLNKLALIGQIGQILNHSLMENKPLPQLFSEVLKVMALLNYCENLIQQELTYLYFLNMFLRTSGWGLNFQSCCHCGQSFNQGAYLDFVGSSLFCLKCHPHNYRNRRLSPQEMQLLMSLDIPSILKMQSLENDVYLSVLDIFRQIYHNHLNLMITNFQPKE